MVALFHDMMHKEIEVYVDDMIAKSHTERDHTVNLKKLFKRLRKFQLKLNAAKCTFGVTSGKLLGFIVSEKGIEVDPDKIRAIQELPPPKTQEEVRGFLGRLNYIARFISQLTCKCDPIFKLLQKRDPGEWNEECQIAFDKIKEYLTNSPVLVPPMVGKPIILYLTVNKNSMGYVLGQHDETGKKEQAIYYLSKKFIEYESKYSALEKMCSRWQVLLSEYNIVYVSQKSIKGSVIVDFLADRANEDYESINFDFSNEDLMVVLHIENDGPKELNPWKMYFDGASNALGHEIGAVLISPNEKYYLAMVRLNFNCTNNITEYEAMVMGLQAAIEMKVGAIELVTELSKQFKEINFNHLPQEENQIADALATLAAMFKIKETAYVRPFDLEVREASAHYLNVEEEVDGKLWFIQREIICRYGLSERIITDNASNLIGAMVKEVCAKFKIKHHNSTTYRPKMNGAVEVANKNVKKIVEKMTEVYKDWHEKLLFALHAYRTSVRTSTGATPYSLVYGTEAVLPIEVEIQSLRVLMETKLEDAEWVRSRYEQLNLIEEKRLVTLCHGQMYQRKMM
ncbi:PREDICTED: uncharacterized protein LOC108663626 [Theobroma cacao]|uniref:Uncharacterized protein LOC108663626 n=1 Tax=Theobroma cacao TaxID=3641 RepID=A0AB32WXF8_THECC|nr:PREDICTED: uncharacterized protein LOC108663626 [Theobroma cacao]